MAVQLIRKVRDRQPLTSVGIDYSNPISKDIAFAFESGIGKRDLITGVVGGNIGSGVSLSAGVFGRQFNFSGSQATGACAFGVHHGMDGATSATWDILVYFNTSNPTAHLFGQWDGFAQEWLMQASAGKLVWVPADGNGAGVTRTRFDSASSLFPSAGWYRVIASWRGGTNYTVLVNGIDKTGGFSTVTSTATSIGTDNTSDTLQIGTVTGGSPLNGSVVFARAWRRGLSLQECLVLHANPWQIFEPETIPLFFSTVAVQLLSPTGDVAGGTWLPSTGTDLFACVDESAASDADYIYATTPGAYQEFTFPDGGAVDPSTGGHVRYRIPAGTGTIVAVLKQGTTTLQTLGTHTLTGSAQDIDVTITASTSNSTDLRVGFTAS